MQTHMQTHKVITIPEHALRPNYFGGDLPGVDREQSASNFRQMCLDEIKALYPGVEIVVSNEVNTITVTRANGDVTDRWCYNYLMYAAINKVNNFKPWVAVMEVS